MSLGALMVPPFFPSGFDCLRHREREIFDGRSATDLFAHLTRGPSEQLMQLLSCSLFSGLFSVFGGDKATKSFRPPSACDSFICLSARCSGCPSHSAASLRSEPTSPRCFISFNPFIQSRFHLHQRGCRESATLEVDDGETKLDKQQVSHQ